MNRGSRYVEETLKGYFVWIPLAILLAAAIAHLMKRSAVKDRGIAILLATPVIAGLLLGLYVVKVGGDFMHARMVLPVLFLLVLPVLLVPVTKVLVSAVAATAAWAAYCGPTYSVHFYDQKHAVAEDERVGYQQWTGRPNPDTSAAYTNRERGIGLAIASWAAHGQRVLTSEGGIDVPLDPSLPFPFAVAAGRLGAAGAETPLGDEVVDTLGLANPVGAHLTVATSRPGHEKELPWAWILADYGDPAVVDTRVVLDGVFPGRGGGRTARDGLRGAEGTAGFDQTAHDRRPVLEQPHRRGEQDGAGRPGRPVRRGEEVLPMTPSVPQL